MIPRGRQDKRDKGYQTGPDKTSFRQDNPDTMQAPTGQAGQAETFDTGYRIAELKEKTRKDKPRNTRNTLK